jgi:N,N'-diacetyllegionaminate synthase
MTPADKILSLINDPMAPALVIGEAGSNHNCSLDIAMKMIDVAVDAGCDAVKFQLFEADKLVPLGSYAHSVLQPLEFPREWLPTLVTYCNERDIVFCASPFDLEAVDLLAEHGGAPLFKIASPEIHDIPLIQRCASYGAPLLISTGMATKEDIEIALQAVRDVGDNPVAVLHCVSLYPAEVEHMHLRMMADIEKTFDVPVGLSDHSEHVFLSAAAVAMGARVIEKHYTLDNDMPGPDHAFAVEPDELKTMVEHIRTVEAALGHPEKEPIYGAEQLDLNNKAMLSRSAITAGAVLSEDMLCVKRAKGGVRPKDVGRLIGATVKIDIAADTVITLDMVNHDV